MKKSHLLLFSFIVIGLMLRLYNLGFQGTNYDENFTMDIASPSYTAIQIIIHTLTFDFTPPLYYLCAHFSMVVFGQNPWAIRLPSAIFGTLLIPVMYLIGKEYKDELYGLLLSGLTTIFYNLYFYSKYGRAFSMSLVWFSLAFYFFMRLVKGDKHAGMFFGLFALLSLWTHLFSVIPIGAMVLYLLWERKAFHGIIFMIVGALPLLNYINLVLVTRCNDGPTCEYIGTNAFGATPSQILLLTPFDLMGYSAIAITIVVIWTLWKHREEKIMVLVAFITLVNWGSLFVLASKTPMILHYSIFVLPMLLMVFILPFWEQIQKHEWKMRYVLVIVMVLVLEWYQIYLINFIQRGGSF